MSGDGNNSSHSIGDHLLENLVELCQSESLSEKGLREIIREIIGLHGVAPNNDHEFFLQACDDEKVTEGILRCLLEYFPTDVRNDDEEGNLPLHNICRNKNITLGMVQLLVDAFPDSVRHEDNGGRMPLHKLCQNKNLDEKVGLDIIKFLLKRCPESARHSTTRGSLPIHAAAMNQSLEFCRLLIEACPGSERITNEYGVLPFHFACGNNTVATVKYFYQLYPESINVAAKGGVYPIRLAILRLQHRSNPKDGIEVVEFLLECNPDVLGATGQTPLHFACSSEVTLKTIQLLIDAFPDSLSHENEKGHMPLHALGYNKYLDKEVAVDILKLLLKRCPESVRHTNRGGMLPIHIAATHQSPEFCRKLIEVYPGSERMTNENGLPFHVACLNNSVATAKFLYELYPESINVADNDGYYPIHYAITGLKNRSNPKDGIAIVKFLLDCNPDALSSTGEPPLHFACSTSDVTLNIVQLLIDALPDSLRHVDDTGHLPIHKLCRNKSLNEEVKVGILKFLLERCPESARHVDRDGDLPIHIAAARQSPEFCRILIEAYPGSERMANADSVFYGYLPFHTACQCNTVATAKYLYKLYPESLTVAENDGGRHPIHRAIWGLKYREDSPETAIEMTHFLLDCDPDVVLQKLRDKLPLHLVCEEASANDDTSKLNVYLKIMKILYDAHPEAIYEVTSNVGTFCEEVQSFINTHLTYARQARDQTVMTTPDEDGQLPLHRALRDNATITGGSMKLLIKGNPSAICTFDNRGVIPLHVACQHHESPVVVEYLIGLNEATMTTVDREGNTSLHYACIGANHAIIALLLDKYGSMSVSKRNAHRQLPIDLLLQNKNEVSDKESVKYTESIYRLIRANPETLMHYDLGQTGSADCQNRKKRKIDEV
jgi:ankyrin repeat protein